MDLTLTPLSSLGLILILIIAGFEIGYRLGLGGTGEDEEFKKQIGVIRSATLAMLAFLIGFSFSGAASRYVDRMDLVVKEANAIGTADLRTSALPEPQRSEFRAQLRQYTADRIALLNAYGGDEIKRRIDKATASQGAMWTTAFSGVKDNPPRMRFVLPPLNDVIDLHTTHLASARRHIPTEVVILLFVNATLAFAPVGYGNGQIRRRFPVLGTMYAIVIATSFFVTIDLDRPRYGFIRVNQAPLVDLLASLPPATGSDR